MATEFIQTRLGALHVRPQQLIPRTVRHPAARAPSRARRLGSTYLWSPPAFLPFAHLLIFLPLPFSKLSFFHPLPTSPTQIPATPSPLLVSRKLCRKTLSLSLSALASSSQLAHPSPPVALPTVPPLFRSNLHTARRYLSRRSLKTPSTLLQNPFPKVTPVPPSLCPSKISRPTVRLSSSFSSPAGRKPSDRPEAAQPQKRPACTCIC